MSGSVLVIDDDPDVRIMFEDFLSEDGYAVVLAESGEQGVRLFDEGEISVVLCDLVMPGMGGIETLKNIRSFNESVPCLIISGHMNPTSMSQCLRAGANRVLEKPVDYQEITQAVEASFS